VFLKPKPQNISINIDSKLQNNKSMALFGSGVNSNLDPKFQKHMQLWMFWHTIMEGNAKYNLTTSCSIKIECIKQSGTNKCSLQYSVSKTPSMSPNSIAYKKAAIEGWQFVEVEAGGAQNIKQASISSQKEKCTTKVGSSLWKLYYRMPLMQRASLGQAGGEERDREWVFTKHWNWAPWPHNPAKTSIYRHYLGNRQETIPLSVLLHFLKRLAGESSIHFVNFLSKVTKERRTINYWLSNEQKIVHLKRAF